MNVQINQLRRSRPASRVTFFAAPKKVTKEMSLKSGCRRTYRVGDGGDYFRWRCRAGSQVLRWWQSVIEADCMPVAVKRNQISCICGTGFLTSRT